MDEQAAKDAQTKQRIISHMNADHHDSVIRYLEHYFNLSQWTAYSGKITDVTLSEVTLKCDAGTFKSELKPPMSSLREARERLVAMDKECVQALGRSDITVREWAPPKGFGLVVFTSVILTLVSFSRRANFAPDSIAAPILPNAFREFCFTIQPYLFPGVLAIHVAEAVHMATGRLRRHNVNMKSTLYWQWLVGTFIEGFGSFQRFDKLVRQKQQQKAQQKH